MHIHVNGEDREIAEGSSVSDLLGELELQADRVAVEINLKIIDRGEFDRYVLHEDDRIEILSFIGGGSPSNFSTPEPMKAKRLVHSLSRRHIKHQFMIDWGLLW
jgi:thiamine biosynthesis protein ThiS